MVCDARETAKGGGDGVLVGELLGQLKAPKVQHLRASIVALRGQDASEIVERMRQASPVFDGLEQRHALLEQLPRPGVVAVLIDHLSQVVQRVRDAALVGQLPEEGETLFDEGPALHAIAALTRSEEHTSELQ